MTPAEVTLREMRDQATPGTWKASVGGASFTYWSGEVGVKSESGGGIAVVSGRATVVSGTWVESDIETKRADLASIALTHNALPEMEAVLAAARAYQDQYENGPGLFPDFRPVASALAALDTRVAALKEELK